MRTRRLLVLLLAAALAPASADPALLPPRIGMPLPAFEAAALDGRSVSLPAALEGHPAAVVVFLSAACPFAKHFAPHLRDLGNAYGPRGVLFVAVYSNGWESREDVAADARRHGFPFAVVKDEDRQVAIRLGAGRTPEALLVDAGGRLRYRGWIKSKQESPDLQRALDAVLAHRPVAKPVTRAFGCAIGG